MGGAIIDKISLKKGVVGSMIFSIVFFIVLIFSNSFTVYLGIVFLACFMMGIYYTAFSKIVKGVSTPKTEGKNTGYFWAFYSIGGTIIGTSGSYFVSQMGIAGWTPLMYLHIACAIIVWNSYWYI